MSFEIPSKKNQFLVGHARLLMDSYFRVTGVPLIEQTGENVQAAEQLFQASFALVSHNTATDPVFNYANQTALMLFECSWEEFTQMPSRMSAESVNQRERKRLLREVTDNGYIENYQGIRISKTGIRFRIEQALVWNLINDDQIYLGQAACFRKWEYL